MCSVSAMSESKGSSCKGLCAHRCFLACSVARPTSSSAPAWVGVRLSSDGLQVRRMGRPPSTSASFILPVNLSRTPSAYLSAAGQQGEGVAGRRVHTVEVERKACRQGAVRVAHKDAQGQIAQCLSSTEHAASQQSSSAWRLSTGGPDRLL